LAGYLAAWDAANADHGARKGLYEIPQDEYFGVSLTGSDVF
jgi:hypothetical protein